MLYPPLYVSRSGRAEILPLVLPVTPAGQAVVPPSNALEPFEEFLAWHRAGLPMGDWGPLLRMVEAAQPHREG